MVFVAPILLIILSILVWILFTSSEINSAFFSLSPAKARVSSATTAKPFPCSFAREASIAAFNASKLV